MTFANSSKFWNWIVASSSDPSAVALTVKGFVSLGVVQSLFALLPLVGIHPAFNLTLVGQNAYDIVYSVLTAVSAIVALIGVVRKVWVTFTTPSTS